MARGDPDGCRRVPGALIQVQRFSEPLPVDDGLISVSRVNVSNRCQCRHPGEVSIGRDHIRAPPTARLPSEQGALLERLFVLRIAKFAEAHAEGACVLPFLRVT